MEKYFFNYYHQIDTISFKVTESYNNLIQSILFFRIVVVGILIFSYQYLSFFFQVNAILFGVFLLFAIFSLLTILPPIFFKLKGRDFFKEKEDFSKDLVNRFRESTILIDNRPIFAADSEDGIKKQTKVRKAVDPLPDEAVDKVFKILTELKLFDTSLLDKETEKAYEHTFTFENLKNCINDLRVSGTSEHSINIIADQCKVATLIYEVFRPILGRDVKSIYGNFKYFKNNKFTAVKYNSITGTSKRKSINRLKELLIGKK